LVASVAQLVEQLTLNQLVVGSNPPRGTTSSESPLIEIFCRKILRQNNVP
jgi:hypothetical protein